MTAGVVSLPSLKVRDLSWLADLDTLTPCARGWADGKDWWFPEIQNNKGGIGSYPYSSAEAQAAAFGCKACPVQARCLADILTIEWGADVESRHGVWGGTMPRDRERIENELTAADLGVEDIQVVVRAY